MVVFCFTGEVALAITVGFFEVFAKMALYFFHERIWQKVSYGKVEIPSFVLWFTGLPASGKKAVANRVYERLAEEKLKVERLDALDVRPLFPETGFSKEEVDSHIRRVGQRRTALMIVARATSVLPAKSSR